MTVAEFMALPDDGNRHELVRGELRIMPPPKGVHGLIEAAVVAAIDRYLDNKARGLGWNERQGIMARNKLAGFVAGGEFGMQFTLPDDPNQIRGADAAYVPADQFASVSWDRKEYFPAVPHLVIEVISSSERADDIIEKVQDYLTGGARRVWCLYPARRAVYIHDADGPMRVVRGADAVLTDDELLPGFSVPLNMFFVGE
jgi:Uma2 family endonuclease